jgi:uncharacterized protein (TIGR03067 family)
MIIKGDEMTGVDGEKRSVKFKLYPTQSPKAIDLTKMDGPFQGITVKGIYDLEGGRLKICAPKPSKATEDPPKEFKKRDGVELIVLERVSN